MFLVRWLERRFGDHHYSSETVALSSSSEIGVSLFALGLLLVGVVLSTSAAFASSVRLTLGHSKYRP